MLFTRCPECATTFRVSDEALRKASGQVRCGRCASVFNAFAERLDAEPAPSDDATASAPPAETPAPPPDSLAPPTGEAPETPPPTRDAESVDPTAASIGASSVAEVVAEAELAATEPRSADATDVDFSAEQVDEVLAALAEPPPIVARPSWSPQGETRAHASRWWGVGATLAVLVLGAQVVNHFRATLAGHPAVGPWVQRAYGLIGITVTPHWDVRQYEILDWVATAEPNPSGVGSLKISARIQNRGPQRQPYPDVQLRLKDRWEEAVGSRMFAPDEYLSRDASHAGLMSPGETARAEIEVVDPGPDAYGFELDVCIEVEANKLTCRNDKVFL
jgi:predicted Zn finger-like uncharacterized protein